ncbi:MAG: multidrug effflux MFS transporter [Alphaproteobacteria bacterium]
MKNWQKIFFPYALVMYEAVVYLANDMYLPSLPTIAHDLNTSQDMVQYTLSLWFLGTCGLQIFLGPLSDYFGRRSVLLGGAVLFFLSTFMCAYAVSIEMLLVARFLQGAVVGTVTVAGYAAIHEFFDGPRTVQLLSVMASIIVLAPAAGPIVGAWILGSYSWRVIFLVLAWMGIGGMVGIYITMPSHKLRVKSLLRNVIKDYQLLLKNRRFMRYALSFCLIISSFFIWIVEGPFVVIEGLHLTPKAFGWMQVMIFGCFGVGGLIAKKLISLYPVRRVIQVAMVVILLGASLFVLFSATHQVWWVVTGGVMVIALGAALGFGSLNRLAIESAQASMANRTAAFSLLVSGVGTFASFVMTFFNNRTFLNLSVVMAVFLLMGVGLVWPVLRDMKFKKSG